MAFADSAEGTPLLHDAEIFRMYNAQVLSYIESGVPGYFHTSVSSLANIDRVQTRFLRAVGLSEEEALVNCRLAPLSMRRDIAILGFLHRVVLELTSSKVAKLFPYLT